MTTIPITAVDVDTISTHIAHLENEADNAATKDERIGKLGGVSALRAVLGEAQNDADSAPTEPAKVDPVPGQPLRIDFTISAGGLPVVAHTHRTADGSDQPQPASNVAAALDLLLIVHRSVQDAELLGAAIALGDAVYDALGSSDSAGLS